MQILRFRKRPVVIQAVQLTDDNLSEVAEWCGGQYPDPPRVFGPNGMDIPTLEGTMIADIDDWIIQGVKGEFYPCKPDIMDLTYELVG